MGDASVLNLLNERGYQPIELTSVMLYQTLDVETKNETRSSKNSYIPFVQSNVAALDGASTIIPEFRNRGAQTALLAARLNYAVTRGEQNCDDGRVAGKSVAATRRE